MFRIHFDPKLGVFVIQVSAFWLFWVTINSESDDNKSYGEILRFGTYDEAIDHVSSVGLDKLYKDRSANKFRAYLTSASND